MKLTHHQQRVAYHVLSVGAKKRAKYPQLVSSMMTAITESNIGNPAGGDGSSVGWRQETKESYPNVNRRNVRQAAARYFDEAKQVKSNDPRVISDRTQRSANPQRLNASVRRQAEAIVKAFQAGKLGKPPAGGSAGTPATKGKLFGAEAPGKPRIVQDVDSAVLATLLSSGAGKEHRSLLQGVVGRLDSGAYSKVYQPPGVAGVRLGARPATKGHGGGGHVVEGSTKVRLAPGADRAGVHTSHFLRRVLSGVAGIPGGITITTGSNHSRMTVDGNVSDHWTGHASDIAVPVDSARGDLIAGRVLMRLGVPRAKARAMARQGGLFNIQHGGHRWQVIWKTNQGGNHHNHVHVGVR